MNMKSAVIMETERLEISYLDHSDSEFILELFNTKDFHRFIGDRKLRTDEDAKLYIDDAVNSWYRQRQIGMFKVSKKGNSTQPSEAIGVCGLLQRDYLDALDLGYALLPKFYGNGYASEASKAIIDYAVKSLHQEKLWAFSDPENKASIKLLESNGFEYQKVIDISSSNIPNHVFLYVRSF